MGHLVGQHCYATWDEAAQVARWNLGHDTTIVVNGLPHLVQYTPVGTSLKWSVTRMTDYVEVAEATLSYSPPACEVLGVEDGLQMGWMVAAVLVGTFAVMFIAKALRGETGETYGAS